MKKHYWILLTVMIIIAAAIIFRRGNVDSFNEYTVAPADVSDVLLLAGTIEAEKRVDLGFASSGRVKSINFEKGELVKKGQVIAEIEQNRLTADLTQAQANLNLTRANTSTDLETAQRSFESLKTEQETIIAGLYDEYLSGDLRAYDLDDSPRKKIAPVISGSYLGGTEGEYVIDVYSSNADSGFSFRLGGISEGTFSAQTSQPGLLGDDGLYIQFDKSSQYGNTQWIVPVPNSRSTSYVSRKRAYENALAARERVLVEAQNNLDRASGLDSESNVSIDQARRAQARAQVNAVSAQLGDGKIRAAFNGIVVRNDLEIGEIVSAFTPVITVFGDDTRKLQLNTPEIYINKIAEGDIVSIKLDAYPDEEFQGVVDFIDVIDTEVDGVPVYQTDIILQDIDPRIRVGMNAKASIIAEERLGVIAVPNHYITVDDNGVSSVMIRPTDRSQEKKEIVVETGFTGNNGLVEIISGLEKGDIILVEKE